MIAASTQAARQFCRSVWGYEMSLLTGRSALYELFTAHLLAFCYRYNRKYTDDQLAVFDRYAVMAVKVQPKRGQRKKGQRLDWHVVHELLDAGEAQDLKAIIDDEGWSTVSSNLAYRRQKLPLRQ